MSLRIEALRGSDLQQHLDDVARLRIEVFRDYPYLYEGDLDYERNYLSSLSASSGGFIAGAFDGDTLVGAATGAPLADQVPAITKPFRDRGDDVSGVFYFGESVLRRSCRGQGIGVRFFDLREAQARRLGLKVTVFCAVVRPEGHRLRPADHVPLDQFWRNRGYAPLDGYRCMMSWREVDEDVETPKLMQFWQRRLET
jgi:GNAT superfamily N-acetyltransferase